MVLLLVLAMLLAAVPVTAAEPDQAIKMSFSNITKQCGFRFRKHTIPHEIHLISWGICLLCKDRSSFLYENGNRTCICSLATV